MNRSILHPTNEDIYYHTHKTHAQFFYEDCKIGHLYEKWKTLCIENGMKFVPMPDIIKFDGNAYTPFTYKFCFNFPDIEGVYGGGYKMKTSDYELFAKLFLTGNWKEELKISPYGDIRYNTKPWVDYLTFQGYRIILQFRFDHYLKTEGRKEKIQKLSTL